MKFEYINMLYNWDKCKFLYFSPNAIILYWSFQSPPWHLPTISCHANVISRFC